MPLDPLEYAEAAVAAAVVAVEFYFGFCWLQSVADIKTITGETG